MWLQNLRPRSRSRTRSRSPGVDSILGQVPSFPDAGKINRPMCFQWATTFLQSLNLADELLHLEWKEPLVACLCFGFPLVSAIAKEYPIISVQC